ncbi:hypothetical protein F4780DRAFT_780355 [Xylariomycetidae sp. FL0641]|nr:hypothetical protein F4780DRAFT_780355 [Xylariomycetidae sp. FL0641]
MPSPPGPFLACTPEETYVLDDLDTLRRANLYLLDALVDALRYQNETMANLSAAMFILLLIVLVGMAFWCQRTPATSPSPCPRECAGAVRPSTRPRGRRPLPAVKESAEPGTGEEASGSSSRSHAPRKRKFGKDAGEEQEQEQEQKGSSSAAAASQDQDGVRIVYVDEERKAASSPPPPGEERAPPPPPPPAPTTPPARPEWVSV